MSVHQLLSSMCADLPDVDLKAIRKVRGFSASETASRTSFASFYVSPIGLENALHSLSIEENLTLRLLNEAGEVDVSFFERLYGFGSQYGTYTQMYKATFDAVKKNLVRRGLVVMAEVKTRGDVVQLQRWRFALPPEFVPYLPGLPAVQSDQVGRVNDRVGRELLWRLVSAMPAAKETLPPLTIEHGNLFFAGELFTVAGLRKALISAWENDLKVFTPNVPASISPVEAVLKLLSSEAWTDAKGIEPALPIYCHGGKIPPAERLLHRGWEFGLLSQLVSSTTKAYRQAPLFNAAEVEARNELDWADISFKSGCVKVDLARIPYYDLERLNQLAHLEIQAGALIASPSLVKLGRASSAQCDSLLSRWLAEHVPAFGVVLEIVKAKWGQTILHENLLVARVRDLSLRVQLERELKEHLVLLSAEYIAFPPDWHSQVEKVLKKNGFVVKTVKA